MHKTQMVSPTPLDTCASFCSATSLPDFQDSFQRPLSYLIQAYIKTYTSITRIIMARVFIITKLIFVSVYRELFTVVLDMLSVLFNGTLAADNSDKGEDNRKSNSVYTGLVRKLKVCDLIMS